MNRSIISLLGLNNDPKRVYQFKSETNEVSREEFVYSRIIYDVVFGEKGYAETLGPTWELVHDPRFQAIEACFVINRISLFGGDSRLGKQTITDSGLFTSTVNDLEQYAEVLAEGRHYLTSLKARAIEEDIKSRYPNRTFKKIVIASEEPQDFTPVTYDEAAAHYLANKGSHAAFFLYDQLTSEEKTRVDSDNLSYHAELHPHQFGLHSDEVIWDFLKHPDNNPNYFDKEGKPNQLAKVLHASIKVGLIGLVSDYAEIANVQEWVTLETGDIVTESQMRDSEFPRVWLEVDLLEKALTQRAVLRVTAAKVLNHARIQRFLRMTGMDPSQVQLTDIERDRLLEIVYKSDYPDNLHELFTNLSTFISGCLLQPLEERERIQLGKAKEKATATVEALRNGSKLPVTRYTEPEVTIPETAEQRLTRDIMENPLRQELFLLFTKCEKYHIEEAAILLMPVATDPDIRVDEAYFVEIMEKVYPLLPEKETQELAGILATAEEIIEGKAGNHIIEEKDDDGDL